MGAAGDAIKKAQHPQSRSCRPFLLRLDPITHFGDFVATLVAILLNSALHIPRAMLVCIPVTAEDSARRQGHRYRPSERFCLHSLPTKNSTEPSSADNA